MPWIKEVGLRATVVSGVAAALWTGAPIEPARAALERRLNGEAVYDTDRDITWAADANLAASLPLGVDHGSNGNMTWDNAAQWFFLLNNATYLGLGDWHMPYTTVPDGYCDVNGASGYGCISSDMGHLFYTELGGTETIPITERHNSNFSLFFNVQVGDYLVVRYWSATQPFNPCCAYNFSFADGGQGFVNKANLFHVWPVRSGDVPPPPLDFNVIGHQTAFAGVMLTFSVEAADPDGGAVTLAALTLPPGAVFDDATGSFRWTPDSSQTGEWLARFIASNAAGETATTPVPITVIELPPAPEASEALRTATGVFSSRGPGQQFRQMALEIDRLVDRGLLDPAERQLDAFIRSLEADLASGRVAHEDGDPVLYAATVLRASLSR